MIDLIGKTVGQYRIIRELGRGGMAVVYEAYQPALNRTVAVKVLPPGLSTDTAFVQRFLHEARAAARLEHPNIVAIYDVLDFRGIYCIVMQKLDGEPLHVLLRRAGRLPLDHATRILEQIASALDYAHRCGIVHRDVKPANIMVGPGDRAWLTDFGLAQAATGTQLTQARAVIGTPEYMSPEQASGKPVGPASDIYSLGVVLYHMLAGRAPFEATAAHMLLYQHVYDPPPPARSFAPELPPEVDAVLAKALAKDPTQRFASALAMGQSLAAISHVQGSPHGARRRGHWIGLAAGAAGILITGSLLVLWATTSSTQLPALTPSTPLATRPVIGASVPPATIPSPRPVAATLNPTAGITVAPTPRPRPTDTAVTNLTPTPAKLWSDLRVYRPTLDEAKNLPSMWKLAVYRDLLAPGTNTYNVIVHPSDVYRWGFSWHARDQATLRDILQPLRVELLINDLRVSDSLIQTYEDVTEDGWVGRRWVTAIAEWPAGKTVVLEARYELSREVYDGQNRIAPGVFHQIIYAAVQ